MARRRLKLAYISNDSKRKATYRKRKKGIIKKVSELTILCGIPACAIICSPFDSQIEAWPNREGVEHVIERYENTYVIDQSKNVNQESFLRQKISKAKDQLKKLRRDNHEKELTMAMFQLMQDENLPNMPFEDANDLNKLIEKNLNDIDIKMAKLSV
ncbi:hypothetical protein SESBI_37985 [Sesbania bispinosa]|nr:hypothetical protein SESBI_37985 [Sesbania bispinosa]